MYEAERAACSSRPGRGSRRSRRVAATLVGLLVVITTSGCLTTNAFLTIDDDGSGELRLEVFPPPTISGAVDSSGVESLAREALGGVDGSTFEAKERLGQTFYIVKIPFSDFRQLTTNLAEGATVAGQSITPFSQFDLRELPGGGWSLDAVTRPLAQAATFAEGSSLTGLQGLIATDQAGVGMELTVTLPGRLTDSNADSEENDTARWSLNDPTASYTLAMRTEATPLLTPLQWVLAGLLAVFVLGGVLMFVGASGPVKRRSLRKPSRKEHEAFMPHQGAPEPEQPKRHKTHAKRRKRLVTGRKTGWEDPLAHTPVDPMPPAETEPGPHPHRPLPPLDQGLLGHGSPQTTPDPLAGEGPGPTGPVAPFPDSSAPSAEAVEVAHDPAHLEQPSRGDHVPPPAVLPPGPSDDPDYNPQV